MFLTNKIGILLTSLSDAVIGVHVMLFFLGSDEKNVCGRRCRRHREEAGRSPADFGGQPRRPGAAPAGPRTGRSAPGLQPGASLRLKPAPPGRGGVGGTRLTGLSSHPTETKA